MEDLDPELLIYRKFGWLHNYALLYVQDELCALQKELEELDKWEFSDGDHKLLLSRRQDYKAPNSRRKSIVDRLHLKLAQYGRLIVDSNLPLTGVATNDRSRRIFTTSTADPGTPKTHEEFAMQPI